MKNMFALHHEQKVACFPITHIPWSQTVAQLWGKNNRRIVNCDPLWLQFTHRRDKMWGFLEPSQGSWNRHIQFTEHPTTGLGSIWSRDFIVWLTEAMSTFHVYMCGFLRIWVSRILKSVQKSACKKCLVIIGQIWPRYNFVVPQGQTVPTFYNLRTNNTDKLPLHSTCCWLN